MKLSRKIIILAIILGVLTTIGLFYYIQSIKSGPKYINVWVAEKTIPAMTKLDNTMIRSKKVAEEYVLKGAITIDKQITGKYLTQQAVEGEQILSVRIQELDKSRFSYNIPNDLRAITIAVDEVAGVANRINPGDNVDILVYSPQKEIEEKGARIIFQDTVLTMLQNILVLSIETENSNQSKTESSKSKSSNETQKKITLAVSPYNAEKLFFGDITGKIRLTLRNPESSQTFESIGIIRDDILTQKSKKLIPR